MGKPMRYARCRCVGRAGTFLTVVILQQWELSLPGSPQADMSICPNRCCFQNNPSLRCAWLVEQWLSVSWKNFFNIFYVIESKNCSLKITNSKVMVCHCSVIRHSFDCYNISLCLIWNEFINSPRKDSSVKIGLVQKLTFCLAEL